MLINRLKMLINNTVAEMHLSYNDVFLLTVNVRYGVRDNGLGDSGRRGTMAGEAR